MNLKSMIAILALLCSGAAFAEGTTTDYGTIIHHQAAGGAWEVWPIVNFQSMMFKSNSQGNLTGAGNEKYTTNANAEVVHAEYGIADGYSVGVEVGFANSSTTTSPDLTQYGVKNPSASGMLDPNIFFKGRLPFDFGGTFVYGLSVSIGTGPVTISSSNSFNTTNGGIGMTPYIGWEQQAMNGTAHYGAHLDFTGYLNNRNWHDSYNRGSGGTECDYTKSGGQYTELEIYWEQAFSQSFILSAALGYSGYQSTKTTGDGVTNSDDNGVAGLGGGIYAAYFITPKIFIVPVVKYLSVANTQYYAHIQSASTMSGMVYADFMF
jgi:hypothetical protein